MPKGSSYATSIQKLLFQGVGIAASPTTRPRRP